MTNKFRFTDILEMVQTNEDMDLVLEELRTINNHHSRSVMQAFQSGDLARGMSLLNASVRFEMKINKIDTNAIYLSDEEIRDRANNLILINGMTKENAILLAYRRAVRLASNNMTHRFSHASGHFLVQ